MDAPVLLLGFGQTAKSVLHAIMQPAKVYATTRDPMRLFELSSFPVEPIILPSGNCAAEIVEPLAAGSYVLVSFPPDGHSDLLFSRACAGAKAIVYISSTSVYGSYRGEVDENTPVASDDPGTRERLEAEDVWRRLGAIIFRAPGIYSRERGLHTRLLENSYCIPGDGSGVISRIHVEDLAQFVIAAWSQSAHRGETYVIGDLKPVPQLEVVTWLCNLMGIGLPRFAPLEAVSPTLRGHRLINPAKALADLGVTLKYPDYETGFQACLRS